MNNKYYLEDGIEYQPDASQLIVGGRIISLQHLENTLLHYFINHPNQVIHKETLYQVGWAGRICDDNPLTKAISTLRAKLKDDRRNPRFIQTFPKKGFKFISPIAEHPGEFSYKQGLNAIIFWLTTAHPRVLGNILLSTTIILLITLLYFITTTTKQPTANVFQLTHDPGKKSSPDLSHDNQHIVYSRQLTQNSYAQLILKSINGNTERQLTHEAYHHSTPKWSPQHNKILYYRHKQNHCQLQLLTLNSDFQASKQQTQIECDQYTPSLGLSWKNDHSFYFSAPNDDTQQQQIYQFDLNTAKITPFTRNKNHNYQQLHFEPQSKHLFALEQSNSHSSQLIRFNQQGQLIEQLSMSGKINTLSSYQGQPGFRATNNHIVYHQQQYSLLQSPLQPIHSATINDHKKPKMVFVAGNLNNSALIQINLDTEKKRQLTKAQAIHHFPLSLPSGKLYYFANYSGVFQLWQSSGNQSHRLSQFAHDFPILSLAISNNEKYAAIGTAGQVLLFNLQQLPLTLENPLLTLPGYLNPHFSPDSNQLWISIAVQQKYQMHNIELNISPLSVSTQFIPHAYLGLFDQKTAEHFAYRAKHNSLWQIKDQQLSWYADTPLIHTNNSVQLYDHQLSYYNASNNTIIRQPLPYGHSKTLVNGPYPHFTLPAGKTKETDLIIALPQFSHTDLYLAQFE